MQSDPLHNYQRGIIFGFVLSLVFFVLYISLQLPIINKTTAQIIGSLWLIIYVSYGFNLRAKVPNKDSISTYKFPIIHWSLLGVALLYFNVVKPSEFQFFYPIINLGFIIFTLFSADAHWDFKKQHAAL